MTKWWFTITGVPYWFLIMRGSYYLIWEFRKRAPTHGKTEKIRTPLSQDGAMGFSTAGLRLGSRILFSPCQSFVVRTAPTAYQ